METHPYGVKKRRPKKKRDPRGLSPVTILGRDLVVFQILHEYRVLRNPFIHKLLEVRTGEMCSYRALRNRLFQLRHFGYLQLPEQQFQYDNCKYTHDIYALDTRGVDELKKAGKYDHNGREVKNGEYQRGKIRALAHAVQVCDIVADFEIGCSQHKNIRFMSPQEVQSKLPPHQKQRKRPFTMPVRIQYDGHSARLDIDPDSIVGLEYDVQGRKKYRALLIEANQNTEPAFSPDLTRKSHLREVLQYQDVDRHRTFKNLNLPNMTVLNVSVSDIGQRGLIDAHRDTVKGKPLSSMLYRAIPRLGVIPPPYPSGDLLNKPWTRLEVVDGKVAETLFDITKV